MDLDRSPCCRFDPERRSGASGGADSCWLATWPWSHALKRCCLGTALRRRFGALLGSVEPKESALGGGPRSSRPPGSSRLPTSFWPGPCGPFWSFNQASLVGPRHSGIDPLPFCPSYNRVRSRGHIDLFTDLLRRSLRGNSEKEPGPQTATALRNQNASAYRSGARHSIPRSRAMAWNVSSSNQSLPL
jgi:hypothetical protein